MNKVAFITGATRGIGRQIAITLAENGYSIALNYRNENNELKQTKCEIENAGAKCLTIKGDVSNFNSCEEMAKKVIDTFGEINVLVNNAGITKDMLLIKMKNEDFEDVINVNLIGTYNVTKSIIQ